MRLIVLVSAVVALSTIVTTWITQSTQIEQCQQEGETEESPEPTEFTIVDAYPNTVIGQRLAAFSSHVDRYLTQVHPDRADRSPV